MVVDSFELPQQDVRLGIALRDRATFGLAAMGQERGSHRAMRKS